MGMYGGDGDNEIPETAEERELAKIAGEQWQDYQERFVPIENRYMKDVHTEAADFARATGDTASAINAQGDEAQKAVTAGATQRGANANSGAVVTGLAGMAAKRGRALGVGKADVGNQVENLKYAGLQNIVQMGRGKPGASLQGLSDIAGMSAGRAASEAFSDQYESAANASAVGTATGMAARYMKPGTPDPNNQTYNQNVIDSFRRM